MHNKKLLLTQILMFLVILDIEVGAAEINPALTTPAEQARQEQLEVQERLRQHELAHLLRQQQEIKPDESLNTSIEMLAP